MQKCYFFQLYIIANCILYPLCIQGSNKTKHLPIFTEYHVLPNLHFRWTFRSTPFIKFSEIELSPLIKGSGAPARCYLGAFHLSTARTFVGPIACLDWPKIFFFQQFIILSFFIFFLFVSVIFLFAIRYSNTCNDHFSCILLFSI